MSILSQRGRRLRYSAAIRRLVQETEISPKKLIQPIFAVHGRDIVEPMASLPGLNRYSTDRLAGAADQIRESGIVAVILFGVPAKKDDVGSGADDERGIVPEAIRALKERHPDLFVISDVCLCAYTSHGHCGVLGQNKSVDNDASVKRLAQTALTHARAGADMVAPSDMMDHRIAAIRHRLDEEKFAELPIMSYAVKYASSFYGPFREAAGSAPEFGDRRTYQMDPANSREAVREAMQDVNEGADIVMVKPAMPCLDVIAKVKEAVPVPVAAYQVSGEYAMIAAAAQNGWIDREAAMRESILSIARAGADLIISYFAAEMAAALT